LVKSSREGTVTLAEKSGILQNTSKSKQTIILLDTNLNFICLCLQK
jgi:hypothetical protein